MWNRLTLLLSLLGATALISTSGCGDGSTPESERVQATDATPKAEPVEVFPEEPLPLATKPVTGDTSVPVAAEVEYEGKTVSLGSLLSGNSLVIYTDGDTREKQNRAAQRAVRYLSRSAAPMGFRMVVVFAEGTSDAEIEKYYADRKIRRVGRAVVDSKGAFAQQSGWDPRSMALVGEDGQIGLFFGREEAWAARLGYEGGPTADLLFRAWEPAQGAPEVTDAQKQASVDLVRAVLESGPVTKETVFPESMFSAPALAAPVSERVWVSIYRLGLVRRLRGAATGATLGEAVANATRNALLTAGDNAKEFQGPRAELRFSIDVTGPAQPLPTKALKALWFLVEPGIDGVIVRKGDSNEGVVLPHEPVTQGFLTPRVRNRSEKSKGLLVEASRRGSLAKNAWEEDGAEILRFRSTTFGIAVPGSPTFSDMYRGNVLIDAEPGEAEILESLRIGGLWLVNTVQENGKFDYEYFPNRAKGSTGYHIVRHAGSVYGLFEMAHLAEQEPALRKDRNLYLDAAARSMGYIYDATRSPKGDEAGDRRCLISNNRCESGSAALTLLTFLSRPEPKEVPEQYREGIYRTEDAEIMEGLGLVLLDMIDDDGKVFFSYSESLKYDSVRKEPLYYPGETMLALLMFHEKTGDARWLEGAKRIGDRQAEHYRKKRFEWPDHWIMQGFYKLWQVTKDPVYAKTGYNMATHSAADQYPNVWTPFPDYHGAWRRKDDLPRTTRAGSRLEAVRRVVHLAWEDGQDAKLWEDLLLMGADHLIEKQYRPENMWYVPHPDKVIGAYPMGVVDNHLRIDNNQHALVGMLGALEVLRHRKK
ncbi:MAG: hypothetical protein KDA24_22250 [Deltaproteobacteria bacterium]|nr:hypothetical protein [Deltaproteobacteria bacterium]